MKDYTFTQQFILIGLDGLDSLHTSTAKTAVMRGIQAAMFLEENLELLEQNTNNEFQEAFVLKFWGKAKFLQKVSDFFGS